jgi:hypothetical protein
MGEYKQTMPYVPIEVKTHRDAYAATLHVLFKHIADFHLCVVKTFSKKYSIPEDDIIQTIQESPEFKNMEVDPALHTVHNDPVHNAAIESLGYKIDAITPPDTVPKKRIVKKKHTAAETITEPPPIPAQIQQDTEIQPLAKKRVVKKKQVPAIEPVAVTSEPVAVTSEPVAVTSEPVASERETDYFQPPASAQNNTVVNVSDKKKVIKKTTAKIQCIDPTPAPLVATPLVECVKPRIIKRLKTT